MKLPAADRGTSGGRLGAELLDGGAGDVLLFDQLGVAIDGAYELAADDRRHRKQSLERAVRLSRPLEALHVEVFLVHRGDPTSARYHYYLIWITELPPSSEVAEIAEATLFR